MMTGQPPGEGKGSPGSYAEAAERRPPRTRFSPDVTFVGGPRSTILPRSKALAL